MLKAPYVTAKHGLIGLCEVVAKEGAKHNRLLSKLPIPTSRGQAA